MSISKITNPLLWRVVIFLSIFVLISGLIGSRIIGGHIMFRDGFAVYGGLGKAAMFGVIAFVLLVRYKGFASKLLPWRPVQLVWLLAAAWLALVAWMSVSSLLAGDRTAQNVTLAHAGLLLSVACALIAVFDTRNLLLLWKAYRREILLAGLSAGLFYIFLLGVYRLWRVLASIVLVSVQGLLNIVHLHTEVIRPHTLMTDRFGITVAEFCSGIESIALFTALYAIVGLLDRRRLYVRRYVLLFPLALAILFGLNILRVFGLILAGYYINPEIAFSLFHTYAGMVFFILYSVVFWAIAYKYIVRRPDLPMNHISNGTAPHIADHPQDPKKIIISHVYSSDNKGDAALTSVLIQDLRGKFPQAAITILRLESIKTDSVFEGVPEKPSFMYYAINRYHNPLAKLSYSLYMVSATLLWAYWRRWTGRTMYLPAHLAKVAAMYAESDLIVPVGGGYIRSRQGLANRFNIPLLLHPLWLGHVLKKPTVLYAQSMGPFQNGFERTLTAFVLKRMTLILLREDTSVKLLKSMGVSDNVRRAIDSGFLLKSVGPLNIRKTYKIPTRKLLVGVTVRSWLVGEAQARYEQAVATTLDNIIESSKAHIIFIPQVTATKGDDDRLVSTRVRDLMQHTTATTLIADEPDHHRIKAIYDKLDILLGTRFHSVIFSLTSYVPVVAIEYEHKTSGIMHDLKLDKWVIAIEDVTAPKLSKLLKKLVKEQAQYRSQLQKRLPPYVQQASEAADMLAKSYYGAVAHSGPKD